MPSTACRTLFVLVLFAATPCPALENEPATGECSIQLTYSECRSCCDISAEVGGVLVSLCDAATRASGGLLGGWLGGLAGGLTGGLLCEPMMQDTHCYDRCTGKDGDPVPTPCADPAYPDEYGVCRQVCEQGQHNIGSADCPSNLSIPLVCCINEYDPPDDCPADLCPGPLCPAECEERV